MGDSERFSAVDLDRHRLQPNAILFGRTLFSIALVFGLNGFWSFFGPRHESRQAIAVFGPHEPL